MTTNDVSDTRISAEILPCPFCGEMPEVRGAVIGCKNLNCWGPSIWHMANFEDSSAAWNSRHPQPVNEPGEWQVEAACNTFGIAKTNWFDRRKMVAALRAASISADGEQKRYLRDGPVLRLVRLRFFRDLVQSERVKVYEAFGIDKDDLPDPLTLGIEQQVFDQLFVRRAASIPKVKPTPVAPVPVTITDDGEPNYLVWSNEHRAWWRANSCGYSRSILEAGRYTRAEAVDIADKSRNGWKLDQRPDEIAVAIADLPPSIRAALSAKPTGEV